MNFTDTKVTGQIYRVFDRKNADGTNHYNALSFLTDASDVIFKDGHNAQEKLTAITTNINDLKKSVADAKASIASALTAQGVNTPADASFETIVNNVGTVATNKYNAGVTVGKNSATLRSAVYSCATDDPHYGYSVPNPDKRALNHRGYIYAYDVNGNEWCYEWYLGLAPNLKNVIPTICSYGHGGNRQIVLNEWTYNASNGLLYMRPERCDRTDYQDANSLVVRVFYSA